MDAFGYPRRPVGAVEVEVPEPGNWTDVGRSERPGLNLFEVAVVAEGLVSRDQPSGRRHRWSFRPPNRRRPKPRRAAATLRRCVPRWRGDAQALSPRENDCTPDRWPPLRRAGCTPPRPRATEWSRRRWPSFPAHGRIARSSRCGPLPPRLCSSPRPARGDDRPRCRRRGWQRGGVVVGGGTVVVGGATDAGELEGASEVGVVVGGDVTVVEVLGADVVGVDVGASSESASEQRSTHWPRGAPSPRQRRWRPRRR